MTLGQIVRTAYAGHDARWEVSPALLMATPYPALPPPGPSKGGKGVRVAVKAKVARNIRRLGMERRRLHEMKSRGNVHQTLLLRLPSMGRGSAQTFKRASARSMSLNVQGGA